ncbi:MAG: PilZ domain-containing protein [Pseudomonadota bacterium]
MGRHWDRSQRVEYHATVRLLPPGSPQTAVGQTTNLSTSGIFVFSSKPMPVGTELICDLPLHGEHRTFRGRVARVQKALDRSDRGMGIQFLDLGKLDASLLQRVVGTQVCRSIDIWSQADIRHQTGRRSSTDDHHISGSIVASVASKKTPFLFPEEPKVQVLDQQIFSDTEIVPLFPKQNTTSPQLEIQKRRWHKNRWFWLAAVIAGITIVASLVQVDLWDLVVERAKRWTNWPYQISAQTVSDWEPMIVAASQSNQENILVPKEERGPQATANNEPARNTSKPTTGNSNIHQKVAPITDTFPQVVEEGKTNTLIIPITGSTKNAYRYELSNPAGVAVNLPHAKSTLPFGDYSTNRAGFGVVWVHERPNGIHVRVHFTPDAPPNRQMHLDTNQIRITLAP